MVDKPKKKVRKSNTPKTGEVVAQSAKINRNNASPNT